MGKGKSSRRTLQMARAVGLCAWLIIVFMAAACTPKKDDAKEQQDVAATASSASSQDERAPIELLSWWPRGHAEDAMGALLDAHKERFPEDVIINANAEDSGAARKTLKTRIQRRDPPDIFQANIGSDLMQWVLSNGMDASESKLLPLNDAPDFQEWQSQIPKLLLEQLSLKGKVYGVPVNVHRINELFCNQPLLQKVKAKPPTSLAELMALGKRFKARGIPLLAVGSRDPWTLALLIFENLAVAQHGAAFYTDYFTGKLQPDDARMKETLETALELFEYVNSDHATRSWDSAVELVIAQKAVMTAMGDWTRAAFRAKKLMPGKDYIELPFPGSEQTFVFTGNVFAIPKGGRHPAGALRLVSTLASREGQKAIHIARNSIPARLDVPTDAGDAVLRAKQVVLKTGNLVLAQSGLVPQRFAEDVSQALAEMIRKKTIEPAMHVLKTRYVLLR